jgi:hypothetical protein
MEKKEALKDEDIMPTYEVRYRQIDEGTLEIECENEGEVFDCVAEELAMHSISSGDLDLEIIESKRILGVLEEVRQREALKRALKVAEDIMAVYGKEAGFDEDYECNKMINALIALIDAFLDQTEVTEAKELLSEATDMLFLIVERYELGDVSAETEAAFIKRKLKKRYLAI